MKHTLQKMLLAIIVFATIVSLVGCSTASIGNIFASPEPNTTIECRLIRVVDGDTLIVSCGGVNTKVRMIGVNTPESVANDASRNTPEGKLASDYTKNLLSDVTMVTLEFDNDLYDSYDRLLAYVYAGSEKSINEMLLEAGYARTMFYEPNYKYRAQFLEVEANAKANRIGFWGSESGRNALYG